MQTEQKRVRTTPGPWYCGSLDHFDWVEIWNAPADQDRAILGSMVGPNRRANARLVAAAPQMRSALELIVQETLRHYSGKRIDVEYINALASLALDKAHTKVEG